MLFDRHMVIQECFFSKMCSLILALLFYHLRHVQKRGAKGRSFGCWRSENGPIGGSGRPIFGHGRLFLQMCIISQEQNKITRVAPNLMFLLPEAMSHESCWKTQGAQIEDFNGTHWCNLCVDTNWLSPHHAGSPWRSPRVDCCRCF